ncbi:unnamed protein product [Rhizoctonia solani]|uniref:Uncharacterized protein n=1 Tax=Rhizoctonia solani TaxID=456999 RepID=A0A8H3E9F5_9AGAM|nr:unnamed protein product [Rhizoctonia solani]
MDSVSDPQFDLVNNDNPASLPEIDIGTEQLTAGIPEDPLVAQNKLDEPTSSSETSALANATNLAPSSTKATADPPKLQPYSTFDLFSESSNFFRNIQWCADGSSLLGITEHASLEILDLTTEGNELKRSPRMFNFMHVTKINLADRLSLQQPAPILSTAWFPTASALEPASYCFVAAIRDTPIKLFDASDGRV